MILNGMIIDLNAALLWRQWQQLMAHNAMKAREANMREAPMLQLQPNRRSVKIKKKARRHSKRQENERVCVSPCGAVKNERDFLKLVSACFLNITYQRAVMLKINTPPSPHPATTSSILPPTPSQYKRRMVLISKTSSPPRRVQEVDL